MANNERRGRIHFEAEQEQIQTEALAGRMLEQAGLGHFFMRKEIRKFVNSNLGTNDSYAYIEFDDGSWVKFSGMFRIDSSDRQFREALRSENARQVEPIRPDPARLMGDRLMRGTEAPQLNEAGDPVEEDEPGHGYWEQGDY